VLRPTPAGEVTTALLTISSWISRGSTSKGRRKGEERKKRGEERKGGQKRRGPPIIDISGYATAYDAAVELCRKCELELPTQLNSTLSQASKQRVVCAQQRDVTNSQYK